MNTTTHLSLRKGMVDSVKKLYDCLRTNSNEYKQRHYRQCDVVISSTQLTGFLFFMSLLIYVNQAPINDKINSFLDALYFTVTTLTTTGFGDITVVGDFGKGLLIVTMVVGIGLFLKLIKRIFSSSKNYITCRNCRYARHDGDAICCKHCGSSLE